MHYTGSLGVLGVIAFLAFTAISLLYYPGFDFFENPLSALGIGEKSALWFNSGIIISGILFALFFAGLFKENKHEAIFGFFGVLFLIGIGLFPMTQKALHNASALLFFSLEAVCILLFSAKSISKKPVTSFFGFIVFFTALAYGILQNALLQKITVVFFLTWVLALAKSVSKKRLRE